MRPSNARSRPELVASRPAAPPADAPPPAAAAAPEAFAPSSLSQKLSDFEFALLTLAFGFHAWTEVCMAAADVRGLNSLDILVLHAVNHRARGRRQAEICMVLNIEDQHLVAYALKKLTAAGLVVAVTEGRERFYETTEKGDAACLGYRRIREEFLVADLNWIAGGENVINDTAGLLRTMTALYAQAGRFATAATAGRPKSPPLRTKR